MCSKDQSSLAVVVAHGICNSQAGRLRICSCDVLYRRQYIFGEEIQELGLTQQPLSSQRHTRVDREGTKTQRHKTRELWFLHIRIGGSITIGLDELQTHEMQLLV